jgi:hypothetical protein
MDIVELLRMRSLPMEPKRIRMVRHMAKAIDLPLLYRRHPEKFEVYQSFQNENAFNGDYIVSFVGVPGPGVLAKFVGVYQVVGSKPSSEVFIPEELRHDNWKNEQLGSTYYTLKKLPEFLDLEQRVIVQWSSGLAWNQYLKPLEIVEILPKGYVSEFPGYLDFVIDFHDLRTIVDNPIANREWHRMLSAVAGVYLIKDTSTGKHYVGSASGQEGIMGRWRNYVKSDGHGGNKMLRELVGADVEHAHHFEFTVLHTLPRSMTQTEVVAVETLYKEKLGSRKFGLNAN